VASGTELKVAMPTVMSAAEWSDSSRWSPAPALDVIGVCAEADMNAAPLRTGAKPAITATNRLNLTATLTSVGHAIRRSGP
jgi:hypothetical protein